MAETINLTVVTPERRLISAEVAEFSARAIEGEVGILPGHANYITLLDAGELSFTLAGKRRSVAVTGGFAEVTLDHGIRIMAEAAEFAEDIDLDRCKAAKMRAEKILAECDCVTQADDIARAEAALKRAIARISVAEKASLG